MMRSSIRRHLLIATLCFLWLIVPVLSSYGQEARSPNRTAQAFGQVVSEAVAVQPATASAPAAGSNKVYLPPMQTAPRLGKLQFAAELDDVGRPINPTNVFNYGLRQIHATVRVEGGINQPFRLEIIWPDGYVAVFDDRIPNSPDYQITNLSLTTDYDDNSPIDRGTYRARFFFRGQFIEETTAVVR
jgi:hypothetical protein